MDKAVVDHRIYTIRPRCMAAFLEAFAADVFFDDQAGHCELAREVVATGHVPHGISNEQKV